MTPQISYFVESPHLHALQKLPWQHPVEQWRRSGVKHLDIKRGAGRHPVVFVGVTGQKMFKVAVDGREFELRSGIDLKQYLGPVRDAIYFDTLEKHIAEHKWYLSERQKKEVTLMMAAQDWLHNVFLPTCELFRGEGVLTFFPGKTASELYVETMTHKYYLSKQQQSDVGIVFAMRDYAKRFGEGAPLASFWSNLAERMHEILGLGGRVLLGVIE
jgi:hypothetical protein